MLDDLDLKILRLLQRNARITNIDISRTVGIAPSAVLKRIRRLEQEKVILGYETRVAPEAFGLEMGAFVKIHSDEKPGETEIGRKIAAMPEVSEVHFMAADFYYLVKLREKNPAAHTRFIKKLGELGVRDCYTLLILETLKETFALHKEDEIK
ncbi:Leucine-responsive regulatory protein [bioreactor metagenome]|uniref:Leucine-responsive regulatory protein n=1 Tax=bioreactor metagenome TaxID=1076179 RepID=A0A645G8E7_9ZZZZ